MGITFFPHGLPKLADLPGTVGAFASSGIPFPKVAAPFVAGLEVFGGLLLAIGLIFMGAQAVFTDKEL